jgi:hypothetical protein
MELLAAGNGWSMSMPVVACEGGSRAESVAGSLAA